MTKSLPELESENSAFLAAKANAVAEIKRLQDRRKTQLLTASIDEIVSLDGEIRRQEIAGEIADAKAVELRGPIYAARIEAKRWAGVNMPTDLELDRLLAIVAAARPDLKLAREQGRFDISVRNHRDEFKRAFYAVGHMGRLGEPDEGRYFSSIFDDANSILRTRRLEEIEGDAFQAAALAWGDIVWLSADQSMGQIFELGLAPLNQGTPAVPRWREILDGAPLRPALPPRRRTASSSTYPEPRVRIRYGDGREVDPAAPLGVQ